MTPISIGNERPQSRLAKILYRGVISSIPARAMLLRVPPVGGACPKIRSQHDGNTDRTASSRFVHRCCRGIR